MYLFVYLQNLEDFTWPDKILEMDSVTTVYQWYWSQCGEREIEKCPVSYNKMFQSHLELETARLSSVASDLLWRMQVRSDIWSGRINLHCDGGESAFATERTADLSNNDLSSVSGGLVVRAVMRLELVNLEQCHLSLCQMLTVFNSIIESEAERTSYYRQWPFTTRTRYLQLRAGWRQLSIEWVIKSPLSDRVRTELQYDHGNLDSWPLGLMTYKAWKLVGGLTEVSWEP